MSRRLTILKTVLWALVGILATLTVARFSRGLGATTNLSDAAPWGLWIALDVMAGVALAAGGFVLAGTVYIFGREKFRPLVRPAILTAFLGYIAVAVGLLYDLGLPWHIWHPLVYWQHHSVLFEVAMCVMTYLTVLALEFSPVVLEHPMFGHPVFRAVLKFLKKVTIPLVIMGIVLSTLHQSSLGSLFLIVPHRLHELWYSPIIYVEFFISAVALGMMMVTLESLLSAFFYRHPVRRDLLSGLGKAASVVLGLYAVIRVGDLLARGVLPGALDGSWQSWLFIAELSVCAVIPAILLATPRVRSSVPGLGVCAVLVVGGMVWNRLDTAIIAIHRPASMPYSPSWMEYAVSLGVMAAAVLAFLFLVERLKVYEDRARSEPVRPSFDPATLYGLNSYINTAPRRYTAAFITAASLAVLILPRNAVLGIEPVRTPTHPVRTVEGVETTVADGLLPRLELRVADGADVSGSHSRELMLIDGNRNGFAVLFDHNAHAGRMTGRDSCSTCHHLNMPLDRNSSCSECHRDVYEPTETFDHSSHIASLGGNDGCVQCHRDGSVARTRQTATACVSCHADLVASTAMVPAPQDRWARAVGYMDAMHGLCEKCHIQSYTATPERFAENLAKCDACHDAGRAEQLVAMKPSPGTRTKPAFDTSSRESR